MKRQLQQLSLIGFGTLTLVVFQNCAPGLQLNEIAGSGGALVNFNVPYQRALLNDAVQSPGSESFSASDLMARLKYKGCNFDGLLTDRVEASYDDLLARSGCDAFPRAIETWANPPDFAKIQSRIAAISAKTSGRNLDFGLFIAESIALNKPYRDDQGKAFDFQAMCKAGSIGQWGANTCVPTVQNSEYRRYVVYIAQKAIDLGIKNILFGQTGHQDPTRELTSILGDIRGYASAQGKAVIIGQQPNGHQPEEYMKAFDYIVGPVYVDVNSDASPCLTGTFPDCQAILHNKDVIGRANNVIVELDWASVEDDDTHKFARKSVADRHAFLAQTTSKLREMGVGFSMPFRQWLTGDKSGQICYGTNEWIYSPDMAHGCKDEDQINRILNGATSRKLASTALVSMTREEALAKINAAYLSILQRTQAEIDIDTVGVEYWVNRLLAGFDNFEASLRASDEYYVRGLYTSILKRKASLEEIKFYLAQLLAGTRTREQVRADIQYSCDQGNNGECNGGTQQTVNYVPVVVAAYVKILDRNYESLQSDVQGIGYWVQQLINGMSVATFESHLRASHEYFVREAYKTHLNRKASMQEAIYWIHVIEDGVRTRAQVIQDLQYFCQQHINNECGMATTATTTSTPATTTATTAATTASFTALYRARVISAFTQILHRSQADAESDTAGINYWVQQQFAGMQVSTMEAHIRASSEGFVANLYVTIFKRKPDLGGARYYANNIDTGVSTRAQVQSHFVYTCSQHVVECK